MQPLPFFFRTLPHICFWIFISAVAGIAVLAFDLDMRISKLAYISNKHWIGNDDAIAGFIYNYGRVPVAAAVLLCVIGFIRLPVARNKMALLDVVVPTIASIIVGPGLIINGILKNTVNRPRPYDIVEFGSSEPFVSLFSVGPGGDSFSSGHASAGFVLTVLFFGYYSTGRKWTAYVSYIAGMFLGTLLSFTRIIQGGHYFSDTLGSLIITQIVGVCIFHLYNRYKHRFSFFFAPDTKKYYGKKTARVFVAVAVVVGVTVFAHRQSLYHWQRVKIDIPPGTETLEVRLNNEEDKLILEYTDELKTGIDYLVLGSGFPWLTFDIAPKVVVTNKTAYFSYRITRSFFHWGYNGRISIYIPRSLRLRIENPNRADYTFRGTP